MKLPLSLAAKLLLLSNGEKIPASKLKHSIIEDLISEGIIKDNRQGRTKSILQIPNREQLNSYLQNRFAISDLQLYIETYKKEDLTRAELVKVAADSKLKSIRTFKGFLVNSYLPVQAELNNQTITVFPQEGSFTFIYDFDNFIPAPDITIVGIENPENFRHIAKQKHLFKNIKPLFVSRYPQNQSKDLLKWLQSIPNRYLHFGDFDFAGIGIYLIEFKKHLKERADFFIPENIDTLIAANGSRELYNRQQINFDIKELRQEKIVWLISLIHKYKKGLEQEFLWKS